MDINLIAHYLSSLKEKCGLSHEAIAEKSGIPLATIKNLFTGKTENPGIDTIQKVVYSMGGSIDEMFKREKGKENLQEFSIFSLKEMYEFQIAEISKTHEAHVANIRSHYEQHRQDYMTNVEHRLDDKREIIEQQEKHIASIKSDLRSSRITSWVFASILIALLILEVMNPNLGWFRF
jgi:transcriptional regulator with XRE-family HTH domain